MSPADRPESLSAPDYESVGASNSDAARAGQRRPLGFRAFVPPRRGLTASWFALRWRGSCLQSCPVPVGVPEEIRVGPREAPYRKCPAPARVQSRFPIRARCPASRSWKVSTSLRATPAWLLPCNAWHISAQNAGSAWARLPCARATEAWSFSPPPAGNKGPCEIAPPPRRRSNRDWSPQSIGYRL